MSVQGLRSSVHFFIQFSISISCIVLTLCIITLMLNPIFAYRQTFVMCHATIPMTTEILSVSITRQVPHQQQHSMSQLTAQQSKPPQDHPQLSSYQQDNLSSVILGVPKFLARAPVCLTGSVCVGGAGPVLAVHTSLQEC